MFKGLGVESMKVLDLFSGIGGFSLGLERAGMETVAFCEIDEHAQKVLNKNWPNVPIYGDVRENDFMEVEADVITAGSPCQDISNAGSGSGIAGERSGLYRRVVDAVRVVRPKLAIMENVAAILARGMGSVLGDLAEVGYDAEWDCVCAHEVGAPHERDRAWIVAYPKCERQQGSRGYLNAIHKTPDAYREASGIVDAVQREALPYVCGRHDGFSSKLDQDRLTALGNAIVPQIAEQIGRAIMEFENA